MPPDQGTQVLVYAEPVTVGREEAAALVGVSLSHFNDHIAPELPCVRSGARVLYRVASLKRWAERQETFAGRAVA